MTLNKELLDDTKETIMNVTKSKGLDLIDFNVFPKGNSWVIRSIVDYPSGGVTVEECSVLNKAIFSAIEDSNIFGNDFTIEVNSPGLDRPLSTAGDFMRAKGKIISLWLKESLKEKNYMEGELVDVEDNHIMFKAKDDILEIPFDIIKDAVQKIL